MEVDNRLRKDEMVLYLQATFQAAVSLDVAMWGGVGGVIFIDQ